LSTKKVAKPPGKSKFGYRLNAAEHEALDKAAAAEDRSSGYIARRALVEWLKEKGFLK
jgi:predicted transcriptional regulator